MSDTVTYVANPPAPRRRRPGSPTRPVGVREHYLGVWILAAVMMFCTWLLIRGLAPKGVLWGAYDPALFAGPATASAPATAAAAVPAPTPVAVSAPTSSPAPPPAQAAAAPAPAARAGGAGVKVLPVDAGDWQAGKVENFGPDNVYEKINGRAEAYLAYDMKGLEFCSYAKAGKTVDLYIYDMSAPLLGFGMFSSERGTDPQPLTLGQESYQSGGSVYAWQDRYYVQAIAANGDATETAEGLKLVTAVLAKLPKDKLEIPARAWFPTRDLIPHTLVYVRTKALGQDWLNEVYTEKYKVNGHEVQAFMTKCADDAAAQALLTKYTAFLTGNGKVTQPTLGGLPMVEGDQNGMIDVVFAKRNAFGGVTYVDDRAAAEAIAARLAAP